jgi:putative phosphoesterase
MRVAALYDIHGNLPALEAVRREIERAKVDRVVVAGDVVPGPMPRECLALLRELDVPVLSIRGNGESAVLAEWAGSDPGVPEAVREAIRWTATQLSPTDRELLTNWPPTLELEIVELGRVLFCHATPESDTEIFTRHTPEEHLLPLFESLDADLVVCGHTHMPFDRSIADLRLVNAGSVGMPFGRAGADWLLLGPDVLPQHTDYNLAEAAERLATTAYPDAATFAERHVLHPPLEEEMLQAFDSPWS